jgi:hypothetical protein
MYPNPALSAWQLATIAIVAVGTLAIWLTAVYLAAREPRGHEQAAAGTSAGSAVARTRSRPPASPTTAGEREPERPPADRTAA